MVKLNTYQKNEIIAGVKSNTKTWGYLAGTAIAISGIVGLTTNILNIINSSKQANNTLKENIKIIDNTHLESKIYF